MYNSEKVVYADPTSDADAGPGNWETFYGFLIHPICCYICALKLGGASIFRFGIFPEIWISPQQYKQNIHIWQRCPTWFFRATSNDITVKKFKTLMVSSHVMWLIKKKQQAEICSFWPITNYPLLLTRVTENITDIIVLNNIICISIICLKNAYTTLVM